MRSAVVSRVTRSMSAAAAAIFLVACMPTVIETIPVNRPARSVLIVTGAGMVVHSTEEPRYEPTWRKVADRYAEVLHDELSSGQARSRLHIKQQRNESVETVVGRLVSEDPTDGLLQVTVRHARSSTENTVYLKAEFLPLEYRRYSNGRQVMTPRTGLKKEYPILSTTGADLRHASIPDMAKEFVKELRAQGLVL